jgi:sterol desaturase/sphingolipid hydroxylase (fatty acid hydroxylase superfamily)
MTDSPTGALLFVLLPNTAVCVPPPRRSLPAHTQVHDAYYYFLHRALHANRWLYRHVHAHHHDPRVMLEARTGLVISCAESVLGHCIPYAFTLAMNIILFTRVSGGVQYANVLTLVAPMVVSTQVGLRSGGRD